MLWNDIKRLFTNLFNFLKKGGWKKVIIGFCISLLLIDFFLISFHTWFAFKEWGKAERAEYFGCEYRESRSETLCITRDLQLEIFRRMI